MAMSVTLRRAFQREWRLAAERRQEGQLDAAFAHLERAHIIGQRDTWAHLRTHAAMWMIGWRRGDLRELWGQLPRMLAALIFSRLWVPAGNTGGADVSALRPMPVPTDLRTLLADSGRPSRPAG